MDNADRIATLEAEIAALRRSLTAALPHSFDGGMQQQNATQQGALEQYASQMLFPASGCRVCGRSYNDSIHTGSQQQYRSQSGYQSFP